MNYLYLGLAAAFGAGLAWWIRGLIADSAEGDLKQALAESMALAAEKKALAEAKSRELELLREQFKTERKLYAADSSELASGLDTLF